MCELDVFAGNFTLIDWDVHSLWIKGFTASEAVIFLKLDLEKELPPEEHTHEMLESDVNDNYRTFAMLENVILSGSGVASTSASTTNSTLEDGFSHFLQLVDAQSKKRLVETYYSLDSELCREIVGKKLSGRLRNNLDEICEKPSCKSLKLRSARRQYDNVKRVFKTIEDMAGDYVSNIVSQFGLSKALAEKYATLVFAASFKFEFSKKRLNYLNFEMIRRICLILIDDWMETGGGSLAAAGGGGPQDGDDESISEPSLDKDFLTSLRELKALQERDKEHRNVVCSRLQQMCHASSSVVGHQLTNKACQEFESGFKSLTRGVIGVAVGLSHNKEVKDFFVQLLEKLVEPLRAMQVTKADIDAFLNEYTRSITDVMNTDGCSKPTILIDNEVRTIFSRFMKILHPSILIAIPE